MVAAVAQQRRVAFVVEFVVAARTAITSNLLKKIKKSYLTMGEATEDMIFEAYKMVVVVVCSCYVWGGFRCV